MSLSLGQERLFFFALISTLTVHVISCMWIFAAVFVNDEDPNA